jgi:squalene-hopene/tetraprenyl-beta-curcumene cyclase
LEGGQAADGSWSSHAGPAVTALAVTALVRHGRTPADPVVAGGVNYLLGHVRDDGGIYAPNSVYQNYETCLAMVALEAVNEGGKYDQAIASAESYVKRLQWDDGEGHDISSTSYGGAGYGSHKRPDLSNTSFLVDALKTVGRGPDDPAVQKALLFVSRCQNLESEHNTTEHSAKVNDGGFYYTAAAGGSSQAGETPNGGLRSYGSMTYAGLKSMIFAGVGPDDPRVVAANQWIRRHYDLHENPGMGPQGLYYYYHTFAKTLDAIGEDQIEDADGKLHNWRSELVNHLATAQQADGSWVNDATRWLEGDPNLVTAYSLLALSYCSH